MLCRKVAAADEYRISPEELQKLNTAVFDEVDPAKALQLGTVVSMISNLLLRPSFGVPGFLLQSSSALCGLRLVCLQRLLRQCKQTRSYPLKVADKVALMWHGVLQEIYVSCTLFCHLLDLVVCGVHKNRA